MFKAQEVPAHIIFEQAIQQYSHQVFVKKDEDINFCLNKRFMHETVEKHSLSMEEAWLGLKGKAVKPEDYIPHAVIKSAIAHQQKTKFGETFIRFSIQHSFVTHNLVIVKEHVHIDETEKTIFFLGQKVSQEEAKKFLAGDFKPEMLLENPKLFHVKHALKGQGQVKPIATWQMVRLSEENLNDPKEAEVITHIKSVIENSSGLGIYLKTLEKLKTEPSYILV